MKSIGMRNSLAFAIAAVTATLGMVGSAVAAPRIAPSRGDRGSVDTVVAYFDGIAAQDRAEFEAAAQKEAYLSLRKEPGTLSYHIVPDPADPTRFVFEATFRDAAAYAFHRSDYPARDFLALVAKDGISGPHIIIDNTSVPNELG
jgi:quinol monooxygenase YgiN